MHPANAFATNAFSAAKQQADLSAAPATILPLERIGPIADRVDRITYNIEQFNERFFVGRCEAGGDPACHEVPRGHAGEIDRLMLSIDRLDTAVQALGNIG
ncbi:MAG: hypothetical protein JWR80_9457 [Bradyrhizobium sp.]|nr:hypothetical protein [Bradyrhizobium sp.]